MIITFLLAVLTVWAASYRQAKIDYMTELIFQAWSSDMNLATLNTRTASKEGRWLELDHPADGGFIPIDEDNSDLGNMRILVMGRDSDEFQAIFREVTSKRLESATDSVRGGSGVRGMQKIMNKAIDAMIDDPSEGGALVLAKCTLGWEGSAKPGCLALDEDEFLECTEENALRVYTDFAWIREQVDAFMNDRANFLGNL